MTVNTRISATSYNTIRNAIVKLLGTSSTSDATRGYGQTVYSSAVSEGKLVTKTDWDNLRYDIVTVQTHQAGSSSPVSAIVNTFIKSDNDSVTFTGYVSGTTLVAQNITNGMLAVGQTLSGSGVPASTTINASTTYPSVTISSFSTKTGPVFGNYSVRFNIPTQSIAPVVGINYTISGNSNSKYNGTRRVTASSTTSITFEYIGDPGTYGSGTTTFVPVQSPHGPSAWTLNNSLSLSYRSFTANSTVSHPVESYQNLITTLDTNRFNIAAGEFSQVLKKTATRTTTWNQLLQATQTITFANSDQARHFFNSGGLIQFVSSRTGGTSVPGDQNSNWSTLLAGSGTVSFGGITPTSGFTPMNGQNFYRLTGSYQTFYTNSGTGLYSTNTYKIEAKCNVSDNSSGTATSVDFRITWIDDHTAQGTGPDAVTGTLTLNVYEQTPAGDLFPSGTFAVTSPTYSNLTITSPATYSISSSTVTVNEGDTINFTVTTTNLPDNTKLFYEVEGTGSSFFNFNQSDIALTDDLAGLRDASRFGSVIINSNTGIISVKISNVDSVIAPFIIDSGYPFNRFAARSAEGSETFKVYLYTGSNYPTGTYVAASSEITVADTAKPAVSSTLSIPNTMILQPVQGHAFSTGAPAVLNYFVYPRDMLYRLGWYYGKPLTITQIQFSIVQAAYNNLFNDFPRSGQAALPLRGFGIGLANIPNFSDTNPVDGQYDLSNYTWTTVWGKTDFTPSSLAYNPSFLLTTPFVWDGTSSLGMCLVRDGITTVFNTDKGYIRGNNEIFSSVAIDYSTDTNKVYNIGDAAQYVVGSAGRPAVTFTTSTTSL